MPFLNPETSRHLGFDQIWSRIRPLSALGRARHRQARAFLPEEKEELQKEWDRLERICSFRSGPGPASPGLIALLGALVDVKASLQRSRQGLTLDDAEFYEIKKLVRLVERIGAELERLGWAELLPSPLESCSGCKKALSVGQGDQESFYIAGAYQAELARVRQERSRLEDLLTRFRERVQEKIKALLGRTLSLNDEIRVSSAEEAALAQLTALKELVKVQETPYFVTFRLVEGDKIRKMRGKWAALREQEERCKEAIRGRLTKTVSHYGERLLRNLERLAFLDFLLAKAEFCAEFKGVKPRLSPNSTIWVEEGRHLLLEEEVKGEGRTYFPLTVRLKAGVTLITGPNMGGKTSTLKTIGLLTAMAQFGLLVPAASFTLKPRRCIAVPGASQGFSAFAAEMAFLGRVLKTRDQEALILVDEIAGGTNPEEGAAIAQAVLEKLNLKPSISVVTTHYPSLARLEELVQLRVRGLDEDLLKKLRGGSPALLAESLQGAMDYSLEAGKPEQPLRSGAAVVAEAVGLDAEVLQRAFQLLQSGSQTEKKESSHG